MSRFIMTDRKQAICYPRRWKTGSVKSIWRDSVAHHLLGEIKCLFVQALEMAREIKLLKLGTVCLDGWRQDPPSILKRPTFIRVDVPALGKTLGVEQKQCSLFKQHNKGLRSQYCPLSSIRRFNFQREVDAECWRPRAFV